MKPGDRIPAMRERAKQIAGAPAFCGEEQMHKSTDRILTTHAGSIPRGQPLGAMLIDQEAGKPVDKGALHSNIDLRVSHVLAKQAEARIDVVNDGEQGALGFKPMSLNG